MCIANEIPKSPDVEFCGYSIPHPSEAVLHLRIQTWGWSYLAFFSTYLCTYANDFQTVSARPKSCARASRTLQISATRSRTSSQHHGTHSTPRTPTVFRRASHRSDVLFFFFCFCESLDKNSPCLRRYRVHYVHKSRLLVTALQRGKWSSAWSTEFCVAGAKV